jgi:hypothetical protein
MTEQFSTQMIAATIAEPHSGEAQVAGWGPATAKK